MPTRNINLTDRLDAFVEGSVSVGRYQNASEVVREALRLLELRDQADQLKLKRLRAAVRAGDDAIARGAYQDLGPQELADYVAGLGASGRHDT